MFWDFGVEVEYVDIYCLDRGSIDIEMLILVVFNEYGECEKLVVLMFLDIFKENIVVKYEEKFFYLNGYSLILFGLVKMYFFDIGLVIVVKGGGFVLGDFYVMMDLSVGKYVFVISDGMGNG